MMKGFYPCGFGASAILNRRIVIEYKTFLNLFVRHLDPIWRIADYKFFTPLPSN